MRFAILALVLSACLVQGGGEVITPPIGQMWNCEMTVTYGLDPADQLHESYTYQECFTDDVHARAWVQDWYSTVGDPMIIAKNYGGGGVCGGGCHVDKLNLCSAQSE